MKIKTTFHPEKSERSRFLILLAGVALCAANGCSLRQAYPETQIRGYINGQPFSIQAPKDATLTGFDATTATNGAIHVHIDALQASHNPPNPANAPKGQAAIIPATAAAINQAMSTAAATALKAAAAQ